MARSRDVKTYELGTPTAEYVRDASRNISTLILLATGGVIALLSGALIEGTSATLCLGGAGLVLIGLAAYGGAVAFRDRDQTVRVFLDGLIETRGGQNTVIRWDQIDGVVHSIGQRRRRIGPSETHLLTLMLIDGTRIQYSEATLEGVEELSSTVKHAIIRRELPRIAGALRNGETVTYGNIRLDRHGITTGRKRISWTSVTDAREQNGRVSVRAGGRWQSLGTGSVPNAHVLVEVVQRKEAAPNQRQGA